MESIYYRINHKKKLTHFDNVVLAQMKSALFYELSSKNESRIYDQILKIFNSLINDFQYKQKDKLYLIYALTEEYKKMKNIQIENYDKISLGICEKIVNSNFKMNLDFNKENINDISILMSLGFTKLFSSNKLKIKTYDSFIKEIQGYRALFIDIRRIYKSYNYSLPPIVPEIQKSTIPNEILLLMEVFQGIKNINLNLKDTNKESLIPYFIVLLNYDWLFPFVFEINLDLSFVKLAEEIQRLYYLKEKSVYIKNKKNFFEENELEENKSKVDTELKNVKNINLIKNDKNFYNNKNLNWLLVEKESIRKRPTSTIITMKNNNTNLPNVNTNAPVIMDKFRESFLAVLRKYSRIFDIVLCYYYLIKEVKYLKSLTIYMPNGFIKENVNAVRLKNLAEIEIRNINIFEYLTIISSLISFNITFNALEQRTFENVLYMIQNNGNLKELKIDFFPKEIKNLNTQNILKIAEECSICQRILSSFYRDSAFLTLTYDNLKIVKQKILEKFEINIEKLFLLFQAKKHLEKIELIIDLPLILCDIEGYHWAILKLLFNLFILMNKEVFSLKEFKLSLPFFNFDNRKYPIIGDFLEKINLNEKHQSLKNFSFNGNIFKLNNIINIIPYNVSTLHIGEFDVDTFKAFVEFYQREKFLEKSQLKNITIELNKTVIKYRHCKDILTSFIAGNNPKNLVEISFKCYFKIKKKKLYELLLKGNGNKIEKYNIIMKFDNIKIYKKIINHNDFYFMNNEVGKRINKYIPVLKKYKLIEENKKSITQHIMKFLMLSNRKKISIENVS